MGLDITGIGSIADFAGKVLDRVIPDPVAAAQAKVELAKAQMAGEFAEAAAVWDNAKAQTVVNAAEATNPSVFVSGARPFILWVCGIGLAMQFLVAPLLQWGFAAFGKTLVLPPLDMGTLLTMLGGMLGLSGMRMAEKINGVARK